MYTNAIFNINTNECKLQNSINNFLFEKRKVPEENPEKCFTRIKFYSGLFFKNVCKICVSLNALHYVHVYPLRTVNLQWTNVSITEINNMINDSSWKKCLEKEGMLKRSIVLLALMAMLRINVLFPSTYVIL